MIEIEKSYIMHEQGNSRLCADIIIDDKEAFQLYFEVDSDQEDNLCVGRAEAFVMSVLPYAVRKGHEIYCQDALSERLYYQLNEYLLPALTFAGRGIPQIKIHSSIIAEPHPNKGAVGTYFSGNADSFYTIMKSDKRTEYPLSYITVFNWGAVAEGQCGDSFAKCCGKAADFAREQDLKTVFVDTNLSEVFRDEFSNAYSFWKIACVLALQGLFAIYLMPSVYDVSRFKIDLENSAEYDLLTTGCASTESLSIYLSGSEIMYEKKIQVLVTKGIYKNWIHRDSELKSSTKESDMADGEGQAKVVMPGERHAISIGRPYIEEASDGVYMRAKVRLYTQAQVMWFSVNPLYREYLTEDRSDAFVVALLTTAMRGDRDIVCEAPVTRRLLYQMNHYLIPMLAENIEEYHRITVYAEPTDMKLECFGAVGTGWTGGVDSMFTYMRNYQNAEQDYRLTHLVIANNGAIEGKSTSETLNGMVEKTEKGFSNEAGLSVIGVDTNFEEILSEKFLMVMGLRHSAVILALQKLFAVFLISSSYDFSEVSFRKANLLKNIGYYEMPVLNWLETDSTVFYLSGGAFTRMQKLKGMSDFSLARKYLHPCIYALRDNCGKCGKCIWVETALYSLGVLEEFSDVFDIEEFKKNKDWYIAEIMKKMHVRHYRETLQLLGQQGVNLKKAKSRMRISLLRGEIVKWTNFIKQRVNLKCRK